MAEQWKAQDDCLFCRIIRGEIPSTKLYEDEKCYAFRDINPQAPVHFLVVPKLHVPSVDAVDEEAAGYVGHIFRRIPELAAQEGLNGGYRVIANCGPDAGQTVPHLHFHVLGGRSLGEHMV